MKNLVLIGGGGHCKSVLDAALSMNEFDKIVITDSDLKPGTRILDCEVVGNDAMLPQLKDDGFGYAFITVGSIKSCALRKKLAEMAESLEFLFPVIKDPSAVISEYTKIGEGTFIGKKAVINADAVIGRHCIINTGSIIEHECRIGDFVHAAVGAILCGNVEVEDGCFIGTGTQVIQGISIGRNSVIGAGAVVNKNLPDNCTAVGVPAKVIKINDK